MADKIKRRNVNRFTQYRQTLPDASYDTRVTDMSRPLNPPPSAGGTPTPSFVNRNVTNTTPFQLVGNAASIRALPRNPRRCGLQIQNLDAAGVLVYAFGNSVGAIGLQLIAGAVALYDFTTPADELYLFSTANIYVVVMDVSRGF